MHSIIAFAAGIISIAAPATAQVPTEMQGDDVYVVHSRDNPAFAMAAWDDGGTVKMAASAEADEAPDKAVKYTAKQVIWPTGRVRVLMFGRQTAVSFIPLRMKQFSTYSLERQKWALGIK